METIDLAKRSAIKRIVLTAFPEYRKRKVFLSEFSESGKNINSFWEGGSRNVYAIVHLPSMSRSTLPTQTHPYFDVALRGAARQETPDIVSDAQGNVTLKRLPVDFALVEAGTFCGKPATAHIYLHGANLPNLLTF